MHEQEFADYVSDVAAQFGFTGVHYDAAKDAIVFPSSSENAAEIPEALRDQPSTFFAFLAGSLAIEARNITLQPSKEGALLQIKGSSRYDPYFLLDKRGALLDKIDEVSRRPNIAEIHHQLIRDYQEFVANVGFVKPGHLPQDHVARSPADYTSGQTPSKAGIGPHKAQG